MTAKAVGSVTARAAAEPPQNIVTTSRTVCSCALISCSMNVENNGSSSVSIARSRLRTGERSSAWPAAWA